jgi:hypothetical protein
MKIVSRVAATAALTVGAAFPAIAGAHDANSRGTVRTVRAAHQIVTCDYKSITGYFLVGMMGSLGCRLAYMLESHFDKPAGTVMRICPNQALPDGWHIINIVGIPKGCPTDSNMKGSYWEVRRDA